MCVFGGPPQMVHLQNWEWDKNFILNLCVFDGPPQKNWVGPSNGIKRITAWVKKFKIIKRTRK